MKDTAHPAMREWQGGLRWPGEQARAGARTAVAGQPELDCDTRSDRAADGEPLDRTWVCRCACPLVVALRHDARVATANAEAIEAEIGRGARAGALNALPHCLPVSGQQPARNWRPSSGATGPRQPWLCRKSFRLGESDLPTRLRIEAEAVEADRALGGRAWPWPSVSRTCARRLACCRNEENDMNHKNPSFGLALLLVGRPGRRPAGDAGCRR